MTRVKICGLTNLDDTLRAVELGADAVGFIFAPSPRRLSPHRAREIAQSVPLFVAKIGVFAESDLSTITGVADYCGLDIVQIHGDGCWDMLEHLPRPYIKAFAVRDDGVLKEIENHDLHTFLLDGFDHRISGGTGRTFDWSIARQATRLGKLILSGGLKPENVGEALESVHPYAVDICSGIEKSPGIKDHDKMRRFFDEVRAWDSQTH